MEGFDRANSADVGLQWNRNDQAVLFPSKMKAGGWVLGMGVAQGSPGGHSLSGQMNSHGGQSGWVDSNEYCR